MVFPHFYLPENLKVEPLEFRAIAANARARSSPFDRSLSDFVAAYACEAVSENGMVAPTDFRALGGGQTKFFDTIRNLCEGTDVEHVRRTLFEPWDYTDPLEKHSMRWDPRDDKRHAYQWTDPTHASERKTGGMWGANRLAVEGLPLFPTMPTSSGLHTTSFNSPGQRPVRWRWPIWTPPIPADVCESLLCYAPLQDPDPPREQLRKCGMVEVFESYRTGQGYYRNFTQARAV